MAPDDTISHETEREIERFLQREASLIDERRFDEWLDLMTDDVEYRIPQRVVKEKDSDEEFGDLDLFRDNKYRLQKRVERLETDFAWAEDPPTRTRHFVSNVRVGEQDDDGEVDVKSNLLLTVTRDDEHPVILSGLREDALREGGDGWKLADRVVRLDQSKYEFKSLSFFI